MQCTRCNGSGVEPDTLMMTLAEACEIDNEEWFEVFWATYGKVGPRKKAHECFMAAIRRGHEPDVIVAGLRRWMAYWNSPGAAAMKWPQGFLNQEYFADEPPAPRVDVQRKAMPGRSGIEAAIARRTERPAIGGGS